MVLLSVCHCVCQRLASLWHSHCSLSIPSVCRLSQLATCDKRSEKTKSHKAKLYTKEKCLWQSKAGLRQTEGILREQWLCQTAYTYGHVISVFVIVNVIR